jgi:hypothetical protein
MHAHFCVGRLRKIPEMMADSSDADMRAHIIGLIEHCHSGPYTYALEDDGPEIEPDFPVSIAVTTAEEPSRARSGSPAASRLSVRTASRSKRAIGSRSVAAATRRSSRSATAPTSRSVSATTRTTLCVT